MSTWAEAKDSHVTDATSGVSPGGKVFRMPERAAPARFRDYRFPPMSGNRLTSVTNAVRLIKSFTSVRIRRGESASCLAPSGHLSKSSVHRILATLTDEGMLEQDQEIRPISAWPCHVRSRGGGSNAARPSRSDFAANDGAAKSYRRDRAGRRTRRGTQVVYIERLDSPNTLRLFTDIGRRVPDSLHQPPGRSCSPTPQIDRRDRIAARAAGSPGCTPYSDHDAPSKLRAELDLIPKLRATPRTVTSRRSGWCRWRRRSGTPGV